MVHSAKYKPNQQSYSTLVGIFNYVTMSVNILSIGLLVMGVISIFVGRDFIQRPIELFAKVPTIDASEAKKSRIVMILAKIVGILSIVLGTSIIILLVLLAF